MFVLFSSSLICRSSYCFLLLNMHYVIRRIFKFQYSCISVSPRARDYFHQRIHSISLFVFSLQRTGTFCLFLFRDCRGVIILLPKITPTIKNIDWGKRSERAPVASEIQSQNNELFQRNNPITVCAP